MKMMHCRSSTNTVVFILSSSLFFANVRGFITTTTKTSITTRFHEGQDFWAISHSSLAGIPPAFSIVDDDDDQEEGNDDTITSNKPYLPSDFTIEDDDDDVTVNKKIQGTRTTTSTMKNIQQSEDELYSSQETAATTARPRRPRRPKKVRVTNWMEKNDKFTTQNSNRFEHEPVAAAAAKTPNTMDDRNSSPPTTRRSNPSSSDGPATKTTFRQDFRGTRVFVQGISPGISWQDLKDHFRVAGEVVFASISVDMETGMSKGHGIVQFETTQMAQNAINIMRDHPLNGQQLFVREDYQDEKSHATLRSPRQQRSTPPSVWKCANEDNAAYMDEGELKAIESLIKARDDARKRKKFDVSDQIRDELKEEYGVFVDDRLKMWWTAVDGSRQVPKTIQDIKGDGRWKIKAWRQIPTTPENDACVDPDLVEGLLKQRDIARREKDFASADALLEQARTSPDGDLMLRIHDESRTWRIWTEAPPPRPVDDEYERISNDPIAARKDAAKRCIEIVNEFAPEKNDEILMLLRKFPGREFQMLKRLKNQYL